MSLFVLLNGLAGQFGWYWLAGAGVVAVILLIAWRRR